MSTPSPEAHNAPLRRAQSEFNIAYYERRARRLRTRYIHAVVNALRGKLAQLWRGLLRHAARRRAWQELRGLDTQTRQDLALDFADLDALATGEFFLDSTRRQRAASKKISCVRHSRD